MSAPKFEGISGPSEGQSIANLTKLAQNIARAKEDGINLNLDSILVTIATQRELDAEQVLGFYEIDRESRKYSAKAHELLKTFLIQNSAEFDREIATRLMSFVSLNPDPETLTWDINAAISAIIAEGREVTSASLLKESFVKAIEEADLKEIDKEA